MRVYHLGTNKFLGEIRLEDYDGIGCHWPLPNKTVKEEEDEEYSSKNGSEEEGDEEYSSKDGSEEDLKGKDSDDKEGNNDDHINAEEVIELIEGVVGKELVIGNTNVAMGHGEAGEYVDLKDYNEQHNAENTVMTMVGPTNTYIYILNQIIANTAGVTEVGQSGNSDLEVTEMTDAEGSGTGNESEAVVPSECEEDVWMCKYADLYA